MNQILRPFLIAEILFLSTSAFACDLAGEKDAVPLFNACPKDVSDTLQKIVRCQHLDGELNGEAKADKGINTQMKDLKCDTADNEFTDLSAKYSQDAAISKVIQTVEEKYDLESED